MCQVNVIDDAGASFSFPRMAMIVQPGAPASSGGSGDGGERGVPAVAPTP